MRTHTFTTAQQTPQQNNLRVRNSRSTLTLLGVSVLTLGLVSALVVIPVSAKSGRGSSGSSSHHRDDDTLSTRLAHDDDRDDDDDHNRQDRQDRHDDDNDRNRHGIHDDNDRNRDRDDDRNDDRNRNRNHNVRDDDRNRDDNNRRNNNTINARHIEGQVTHVDNMRFTVRTSDGKSRAFKHSSFDYTNDSDRPQVNDRVRVDFRDDSSKQPLRVMRIS